MKLNRILFITAEYPYGFSETFIETEIKYLGNRFEKVVVCPLNINKKLTRKLPFNCVLEDRIARLNKRSLSFIFSCIKGIFIARKVLFEEIFMGFPLSLHPIVLLRCVTRVAVARAISDVIKEIRSKYDIDFIYTYWLNYGTLAAILSGHNVVIFSRIHGYDLYSYRWEPQYVPLQNFLIANTDFICPISKDGLTFLLQKYQHQQNKFHMYRLGVESRGSCKLSSDGILRIVSCSSLIPLKRVDIIAKSMEHFKCSVEWVHFGDGEEKEKIEGIIKSLKQKNIKCKLTGTISNAEITDYYKNNPVDIFVNVSTSEGIPVSIMEAISFGIPVLATNVGGNSEIVIDEINGNLVDVEITPKTLASAIENMRTKLSKYSINSLIIYSENFSAEKNYNEFVDFVLKYKQI